MSDEVAIVQDQLVWWMEQGYTPREAMQALGVRGGALHRAKAIGWASVADWALRKRQDAAWLEAEQIARRAA